MTWDATGMPERASGLGGLMGWRWGPVGTAKREPETAWLMEWDEETWAEGTAVTTGCKFSGPAVCQGCTTGPVWTEKGAKCTVRNGTSGRGNLRIPLPSYAGGGRTAPASGDADAYCILPATTSTWARPQDGKRQLRVTRYVAQTSFPAHVMLRNATRGNAASALVRRWDLLWHSISQAGAAFPTRRSTDTAGVALAPSVLTAVGRGPCAALGPTLRGGFGDGAALDSALDNTAGVLRNTV